LEGIEALGVEPVFGAEESAISYAKTRQGFGVGEIRVFDLSGNVTEAIGSTRRSESYENAPLSDRIIDRCPCPAATFSLHRSARKSEHRRGAVAR